jgi:hypothetical protein
MRFFDDNTRSWWTPITGGSNVPALNDLLAPHGIALGDTILTGTVKVAQHSVQVRAPVLVCMLKSAGCSCPKHVSGLCSCSNTKHTTFNKPYYTTWCAPAGQLVQSNKLYSAHAAQHAPMPASPHFTDVTMMRHTAATIGRTAVWAALHVRLSHVLHSNIV